MATIDIPKPGAPNRGANARFSWITENLGSHVGEYGGTFATEFTVMASQLLSYKLAAHFLGKTGFAEYALVRRSVGLILPIPMLGLAVGLSRFIGFSSGSGDSQGSLRYYGSTLRCVGIAGLVCFVLMNLGKNEVGYLLFGSQRYAYIALPLSLMVLGLCLHTVVCTYFRGCLQMSRANWLQFTNLAIVPILVFVGLRQSLASILLALGLAWIFLSGLVLFMTPVRAIREHHWQQTIDLLRYGVQRVPGDFFLMALFTLPATLVVHVKGVQEAGFVAFGITMVSVVGSVFAPVGLVLLPKATFMFAEGSRAALRSHLRAILRITIAASIFLVVGVWIWIPSLVRFYLGAGFEQVVPIVRISLLGALPYSVYLVVRNLVDAYHKDGVTAGILAGGLGVFLFGSFVGQHSHWLLDPRLAAFLVALTAVALAAGWECRRVLGS